MITLDFAGLHEPKCKGVDKPGADDSDFELWSPHDDGRHGSNDKCFLGQQVTYIRRKQESECFNGEDFERQTMRVPCTCTDADYECDMNYVRNKGGKCELVQIHWMQMDIDIFLKKKRTVLWKDTTLSLRDIERSQVTTAMVAPSLSHTEEPAHPSHSLAQ
jgi:hypothetical protein